MPIPDKKAGENEQDFISRCISSIADEYEAEGQPYAICKAKYDKMSSMEEEFKTLPTLDCIERMKGAGYNDEDSKLACRKTPNLDDNQQGGVVPQSMSRTKFEYPPLAKEKMADFMARCMSDSMVRERKQDRVNRSNFCFREFQNRYIMTIGKKWK
jgi:hypothetical protein